MEIIFENDFSRYFLVAWEFVAWAKASWDYVNEKPKPVIFVGPGRDSYASSIVSYCMGISDVDPIKYGLVFERFINPELIEVKIPRFGFDVEPLYRNLSLQHLRDLYGDISLDDFLWFSSGFSVLTLIRRIEDLINEKKNIGENKFKIENIPIDDGEVFEMFSRGDTDGVFQFEGSGIQEKLKELKPDCIDDLIAINSLYRPAPIDYVSALIEGKKKKSGIRYFDSRLEEILNETYGVVAYQEQVTKIISKLSGLSLGEADLARRSMLKKNIEVKDIAKEKFITGATKNGFSKEQSAKFFEKMILPANFAFLKAHFACYTILAYRVAWLKCHYKKEFDFVRGEEGGGSRLVRDD